MYVLKEARKGKVDRFYKDNTLWEEYLELVSNADELSTQARNSFLQNKIFDALNDGKDVWKELRRLGLLPTSGHDMHGFTTDELNKYFASVSVSSSESEKEMSKLINKATSHFIRRSASCFALLFSDLRRGRNPAKRDM